MQRGVKLDTRKCILLEIRSDTRLVCRTVRRQQRGVVTVAQRRSTES